MSRFFEVHQRDGPGRIGTLMLKKRLTTPVMLDVRGFGDFENSPIVYPGNARGIGGIRDVRTLTGKLREQLPEDVLLILPSGNYPPSIIDICSPAGVPEPDIPGPAGMAYSEDPGTYSKNLYVMDGAGCLENNARRMFGKIAEIKNTIPPDSVLYAPNIATPENLAMLVYLGIDAVDNTRAQVAAANNTYFTPVGAFHLDGLTELPCGCPICADREPADLKEMNAAERKTVLEAHNNSVLVAELALCREMIRKGSLREYVEGKCRSLPWLAALLRHADAEYDYVESRTPVARKTSLLATSSEALTRPEVARFMKRVRQRYEPPEKDILLLLPCSARKPYSTSLSHSKFIRAMGKHRKFIQEVIITSPLGIVPRELEVMYPAAHYDTTVTGYWDAEERKIVGDCLRDFLGKRDYTHIIAHVDGDYRTICEEVAGKTGQEILYTAEGSPTSAASLTNLEEVLAGIEPDPATAGNWRRETLRGIADYQFGPGAGRRLILDSDTIKAPYPRHQVFAGKTQIATLIPQYGLIAPGIAGAERLLDSGKYIVRIDDFVPKGSILAPGVVEADPDIRPRDEVIVVGSRVLATGKAMMGGEEMTRSSRGIAVDLRQVREI
jgi:archaeosine synthase